MTNPQKQPAPAVNAATPTLVELPWYSTAFRMLETNRIVFLIGPPGVGKTMFAYYASRQLTQTEPAVLNGSPQREELDVWVKRELRDGSVIDHDGPLPEALRGEGKYLLIEEFATIPLETRSTFLGLAGAEEIVNPYTREHFSIPQGPSFRVIATSNRESMNCRRHGSLARAIFDRGVALEVPALTAPQIRELLVNNHPHARESVVDWVLEKWQEYQTVAEHENHEAADEFITYRAADQLLRLTEAGEQPDQAVKIALVNKFLTDRDLHQAAKLKAEVS